MFTAVTFLSSSCGIFDDGQKPHLPHACTQGAYFRGKNCTRFSEPFCEFQLLTRKVVIAPHPEAGQFLGNLFPSSTRLSEQGSLHWDLTPATANGGIFRERNVFSGSFFMVNCMGVHTSRTLH
eukprot:585563-Prorocentrum_minimum.AAC.1